MANVMGGGGGLAGINLPGLPYVRDIRTHTPAATTTPNKPAKPQASMPGWLAPTTTRYTAPKITNNARWTAPKMPIISTVRQAKLPSGQAYRIDPNIGRVAGTTVSSGAAQAVLNNGMNAAVQAARESEIARGMGRSGVAEGVESNARRDVSLDVAKAAEDAANQTGILQNAANIASAGNALGAEQTNSGAYGDWANMMLNGAIENAKLGSSYDFANQDVRSHFADMGLDWSKFIGQLGFDTSNANAQLGLGYNQLNENARQYNTTDARGMTNSNRDFMNATLDRNQNADQFGRTQAQDESQFGRSLLADYANAGLSPAGASSAANNADVVKFIASNATNYDAATIAQMLKYTYGIDPASDPQLTQMILSATGGM